jgi:hypothetical protein
MTVMVSPTPMVGVAEAAAEEGSAWDVQWNVGQGTPQRCDFGGQAGAVRKYQCSDAARRQLHRALSTSLRQACRGVYVASKTAGAAIPRQKGLGAGVTSEAAASAGAGQSGPTTGAGADRRQTAAGVGVRGRQ